MEDEPFRLEELKVATPCSERWEDMTGDDRKRFCAKCRLHVYNLAGMTRDEATRFVSGAKPGERVCIRLYRRRDGTVLTRDCPAGISAARRRSRTGMAAAALLVAGAGATVASSGAGGPPPESGMLAQVRFRLYDQPRDFLAHSLGIESWCTCHRFIMGVMVMPSPRKSGPGP